MSQDDSTRRSFVKRNNTVKAWGRDFKAIERAECRRKIFEKYSIKNKLKSNSTCTILSKPGMIDTNNINVVIKNYKPIESAPPIERDTKLMRDEKEDINIEAMIYDRLNCNRSDEEDKYECKLCESKFFSMNSLDTHVKYSKSHSVRTEDNIKKFDNAYQESHKISLIVKSAVNKFQEAIQMMKNEKFNSCEKSIYKIRWKRAASKIMVLITLKKITIKYTYEYNIER